MALTYPFEPPAPRQTCEVSPGVHWVRLAMPFKLDHINVWSIDTDDGWVLVDTGLNTPETVADWQALMSRGPLSRPLCGVYATHMHPDHIGLAGWLTRRAGAPLFMSRLEYLSCRVTISDTYREAPPEGIEFHRQAGWTDAEVEIYRSRFGNFGKYIKTLPDSYRRLQDGDEIKLGAHFWRVITTAGHSPEHVCLYCPAAKLLIAGDQVLPNISSNVSVFPGEPEANPLLEWYASIHKLLQQVPDDVLVLPSHNAPFRGLHERLIRLREDQNRSMERLRQSLVQQALHTVEAFPALFNRDRLNMDAQQLSLATGEATACLNYLIAQGFPSRAIDKNGVFFYSCIK